MQRFKIIGLLVLEKNIFKAFTIYLHGGHLGTALICVRSGLKSPKAGFLAKQLHFILSTEFISTQNQYTKAFY